MKKIFLMFAFAGFTALAANAQTEPTAATKNKAPQKKEQCSAMAKASCTAEEKAACAQTGKICCEKGAKASTSMAAKTEKAPAKKVAAANK